jgi:hypothetical protein
MIIVPEIPKAVVGNMPPNTVSKYQPGTAIGPETMSHAATVQFGTRW